MSRPDPGSGGRAAVLAAALALATASCGQAGVSQGQGGGSASAPGRHRERAGELSPAAGGAGQVSSMQNAADDAGEGPVSWLKGSTHVHTVRSGDSSTPVEDVVSWYREHGYDFIVITDHNRVTESDPGDRPLLLRGIELTHNPEFCDPPPPEPDGRCRIHLNGLGLSPAPAAMAVMAAAGADALEASTPPAAIHWQNQTTSARLDMYLAGIDKVRELGGIVQVNHPTWYWGVDAELLAELGRRGATLVEVANMGFARWNLGTGLHPSTEALWDAALSQGVLIYGVASDDAHDYDAAAIEARRAAGRPVYAAGTGWVMVRAARRADAIRRALAAGDFYSSTGVTLDRVDLVDGAIELEVATSSPGRHEIEFIGQGGMPLERVSARSAHFSLARARAGYVRARVTREDGARAWIQPVRVPPVGSAAP